MANTIKTHQRNKTMTIEAGAQYHNHNHDQVPTRHKNLEKDTAGARVPMVTRKLELYKFQWISHTGVTFPMSGLFPSASTISGLVYSPGNCVSVEPLSRTLQPQDEIIVNNVQMTKENI
jgi:hypothetical protein